MPEPIESEIFEVLAYVRGTTVGTEWARKRVEYGTVGELLVLFEIARVDRFGNELFVEHDGRRVLTLAGMRRFIEMCSASVVIDAEPAPGDF